MLSPVISFGAFMVVQIIGLPCSGKSTAIKKYLKTEPNIQYLDYANYSNPFRLLNKIRSIQSQKPNSKILIESACGIRYNSNKIILYRQPIQLIYQRHSQRKEKLDEDYLSLLQQEMIKSDLTVTSENALFATLDLLFC